MSVCDASCLLPRLPSCSVGKPGQRPRNATAASSEHPQALGPSDFRDFVLEMQQTITDLRTQVPPRHTPSYLASPTDSSLTPV